MTRILTAALFALIVSNAMALSSNDPPTAKGNHPVSKPRSDPIRGDPPQIPGNAGGVSGSNSLAHDISEPDLSCLVSGVCKPQPKPT